MATYPDCCKCSASLCICKSSFCSLKESNLQAADRFMRLMEKKGPTAPQHLVVFITSDEDFSEQIAQLQSRNFRSSITMPVLARKRLPLDRQPTFLMTGCHS